MPAEQVRVGYVLKRYPRYSETFVVSEILAHEAAGLRLDIFALRCSEDSHFQDTIARVRAPVSYLQAPPTAEALWAALKEAALDFPWLWHALKKATDAGSRELYQAVQLAQAVYERGVQHLHAHFADEAATVAMLAACFAGVPYSFTAHAKDIFHEGTNTSALQQLLKSAAAVVTVSDYNVAYLRQRCGGAAARVERLYNGLALDHLRYQEPAACPPRIVAVGRLVEKKGFADLITACRLMAARGLGFSCQIVGTGPLEAELRRQIAALNLQGTVTLLGPRPQQEVIALVQGAAALAAPCIVGEDGNRDGLPTVLLEAMAVGTPCVSTDVTGIPEVVRHEMTGLLVPQHDPEALASALERLLEDAGLRVGLARRARQLVEAEFDARRNAARLRTIFQEARTRVLELA
jgi:colanic acid/amylovoran biosynthesis glycosyltransferase